MKLNQTQPEKIVLNTPNTFAHPRGRLLSFNTPQLSPLKMIQSPFMNIGENSLFEHQLGLNADFRLEEGQPIEENFEAVN
jgi:hypothetical protein